MNSIYSLHYGVIRLEHEKWKSSFPFSLYTFKNYDGCIYYALEWEKTKLWTSISQTNLMMDVVATSIARRMESGNCLN